jgi:hypothetical protein
MAQALCRQCRREISAEEPVCPHCGVRNPADLTRAENWASARDPRTLPDGRGPLRFLVVAIVILLLIALGMAVTAYFGTPNG